MAVVSFITPSYSVNWANTSWAKRWNFTIPEDAVAKTLEPMLANFTVLTGMKSDASDIRMYNSDTGVEICIRVRSNTATSAEVMWLDTCGASVTCNRSLYYNNSAASASTCTPYLAVYDTYDNSTEGTSVVGSDGHWKNADITSMLVSNNGAYFGKALNITEGTAATTVGSMAGKNFTLNGAMVKTWFKFKKVTDTRDDPAVSVNRTDTTNYPYYKGVSSQVLETGSASAVWYDYFNSACSRTTATASLTSSLGAWNTITVYTDDTTDKATFNFNGTNIINNVSVCPYNATFGWRVYIGASNNKVQVDEAIVSYGTDFNTYYPNPSKALLVMGNQENYTVPSTDPCPYSGSGTYNLICGCNITTNVAISSGNFTINGTGTSRITANVTGWNRVFRIFGGCHVIIYGGARVKK